MDFQILFSTIYHLVEERGGGTSRQESCVLNTRLQLFLRKVRGQERMPACREAICISKKEELIASGGVRPHHSQHKETPPSELILRLSIWSWDKSVFYVVHFVPPCILKTLFIFVKYFLIHQLTGLSLLVSYANKQLFIPCNKEARLLESQKILHLILAERPRSVWMLGSELYLGSWRSLQLRLAGVVHHWGQAWRSRASLGAGFEVLQAHSPFCSQSASCA